jgi:SNF2 family DNA or RNA helicase
MRQRTLEQITCTDDGSMRADKREQALEAIRNKPEIKVILISFKAGSTGLNLTCCNNVILMDLWW